MNLAAHYEAVLGPGARRSDREWQLDDPEAARQAVAIAVREREALAPGYPQPGRTGLRPPAGILSLWSGDLVVRAGAGTTVQELEDALEAHGLALGLEVSHPERASLGACFADAHRGFAGPSGIQLRDRCVGLSFVDGRARLLAAGSRVVKNVAGYDFGRLHHGARGSLGLILDLTLRLVARPERRVAVWWACERDEISSRLGEIRSAWGRDAWCELCVDRVAAARYGLPGAGIVFRQAGPADLLQERIHRSNAADVSQRWPALLGAAGRSGRPMPASLLAVEDPGDDWVADLGYGVLRSARHAGDPPARRSRAALAVKRVLDPSGIWPPLPGEEAGER